ncbi:MAG TPA: hypothetical protein EYP71_06180 [Dehalococcoidia bacterium]|nr:hypothetical protein [Dehalococcoidia bacterium]
MTTDLIQRKLHQWTRGRNTPDARISVFYRIRDIPYAVIPELNDPWRYGDIIKLNSGSCTPKHLLLCHMYQKLGLEVLYVVYPFRWDEFKAIYPPELQKLAEAMPMGFHLACKVAIGDKLVLVDATLDLALQKIGLPVNKEWDGFSDTLLAVSPCGAEELYHPSEVAHMVPKEINEKSQAFYRALNAWLEQVRKQTPGEKR